MFNLTPYGSFAVEAIISSGLAMAGLVTTLATFTLVTPSLAQPSPSANSKETVDHEPPPATPVTQAIVVTPNGDRLTVRSGPGASYDVIGSLANGQTLQLSGLVLGHWTQLLGGGWVYLPYLQISEGVN